MGSAVLLNLLTLLLTAAVVHAAPVATKVRLLSNLSGRYVRVANNGTITADGNRRSSTVFYMYLKNSQIQFELTSNPGMFLMLSPTDKMNLEYTLTVGYPSDPFQDLTEWEISGPCMRRTGSNVGRWYKLLHRL